MRAKTAAHLIWVIGVPSALFYPDFQNHSGKLKWTDRYAEYWNELVVQAHRGSSKAYERLKELEKLENKAATSGATESEIVVSSTFRWLVRSDYLAKAVIPLFLLWFVVSIFGGIWHKPENPNTQLQKQPLER